MNKKFKIYDGDCTIEYNISPEAAQKTVEAIINWCKEYNISSGESLVQTDNGLIEAPYLVANIIDDILEFNSNWEEF